MAKGNVWCQGLVDDEFDVVKAGREVTAICRLAQSSWDNVKSLPRGHRIKDQQRRIDTEIHTRFCWIDHGDVPTWPDGGLGTATTVETGGAKGKLARRRSQLNPLAKKSDGSEEVVLDKAAIDRNLESDN